MTDYFLTVKSEVLYEKACSVIAKYEKYFDKINEPLEFITELYYNLLKYPNKIILCDSETTFDALSKRIDEFKSIIDNVLYS